MNEDKLSKGKQVMLQAISADQNAGTFRQFDARLHATVQKTTFHIRADAYSDRCAYLFVWKQLSRQDEIRGALMAALHPNATCECHDLRTGASLTIRFETAETREAMLLRLKEETAYKW